VGFEDDAQVKFGRGEWHCWGLRRNQLFVQVYVTILKLGFFQNPNSSASIMAFDFSRPFSREVAG
jgi:hypothetical protein